MIIPVAFFFDRNYLVPSSVAIISLLSNASIEHEYHIHVFYNGIPKEEILLLSEICCSFSNAKLFSRDMNGVFADLFENTAIKVHYSKEMYYKFLAPSLLPNYDRAIISDVDVVFLGDVSATFLASLESRDTLISGCKVPAPTNSFVGNFQKSYQSDFSSEELERLVVAGGYYVFNLAEMRAKEIEHAFIRFAHANAHRVRQPEQDTISSVCFPLIHVLPLQSLICSYCYDLFEVEANFEESSEFSASEIRFALENPIQLHFATAIKPWNSVSCTKSEIWHRYLFLTPFGGGYLRDLASRLDVEVLWSMKIPKTRTREFAVIRKTRRPSRIV